jgi:transposase
MKEQLETWRKKLLSAEEEQRELRRRIEALAPALRPKGVGAYSTALLEYEMKGWPRFHNRAQVSSYTGLCPGIHQSDGRGKEGSINRCGNPVVRWNLVENGLAADGLATPLRPGASIGGWLSAK